MSRPELDEILRRARRLTHRGAARATGSPPLSLGLTTSLAQAEALEVARTCVGTFEQGVSAPHLVALAAALVRLEQHAAAAGLVRLFADRAPPEALASLDSELRALPDLAAALGLRLQPQVDPDAPGGGLSSQPVLALTPGPRAHPAQIAGVEQLVRDLAPLARREGIELHRSAPGGAPWLELEWFSDEQTRAYAVPIAPSEAATLARLLETLQVRVHLAATWLDDPRLLLEPLTEVLRLVCEAQREMMTPLPPWYADDPDRFSRAVYRDAILGLPGLLDRWADAPAPRRAMLAAGGLRLLDRGFRSPDRRHMGDPEALLAIEPALREACGPALSGLRFAGAAEAAGSLRVDALLLGESDRERSREGPVRLRRTLNDLWAVADSREVGQVVSAVARGLLPLEGAP